MMSFAVGSLVRVRDREWVVLPGSTEELLRLRPLGGADDETTGVYTPLESVEAAQFALPDPEQIGDYHSARLLRAAVRLGFRSSAGPFRCFARINVDEVAWQLNAARQAVGSSVDVAAFMKDSVRMYRGVVSETEDGALCFDLTETPRSLKDALDREKFVARFELPVPLNTDQLYLTRTTRWCKTWPRMS
ncbi:MAG: hypothetical protein ACUVSX_17035 [Aggregatilineales bacterium]